VVGVVVAVREGDDVGVWDSVGVFENEIDFVAVKLIVCEDECETEVVGDSLGSAVTETDAVREMVTDDVEVGVLDLEGEFEGVTDSVGVFVVDGVMECVIETVEV